MEGNRPYKFRAVVYEVTPVLEIIKINADDKFLQLDLFGLKPEIALVPCPESCKTSNCTQGPSASE